MLRGGARSSPLSLGELREALGTIGEAAGWLRTIWQKCGQLPKTSQVLAPVAIGYVGMAPDESRPSDICVVVGAVERWGARGHVKCRGGRGYKVRSRSKTGRRLLAKLCALAGPRSTPTKFLIFFTQSKKDKKG